MKRDQPPTPAEAALRLASDAVNAAYDVQAAVLKLRTLSNRHFTMRKLAAVDVALSAAIEQLERERRRCFGRLPRPGPVTPAQRRAVQRHVRTKLARLARAEWERSG